jgi:uncharacterized protein YndB with AHSA1/START domain
MNFTKIKISATVNASIEKAWNYYNQPEHIVNWNFANNDWHCPFANNNLTVNGKLLTRMEAKDKSFGFDFEATYNEIINLNKIVYTMPDNRMVAILFNQNNNTTSIHIEFDAEKINSIELQKNGWQAILDNFKNYVENN